MRIKFDFDVTWDTFNREQLEKIAEKHGVKVDDVNMNGPGGGNPQVFAYAPSITIGKAFVAEVYGCKTKRDMADYVDPIFPEVRAVRN